FECLCLGFAQESKIETEGAIRAFSARNRLKDEIERRSVSHSLHLRSDVGEDAGLCGNVESYSYAVEHACQGHDLGYVIRNRVHADDGVTAAIRQVVPDACRNA